MYACMYTFRTSGDTELGPLEEKYATVGAAVFLITVLLGDIWIVGSLHFTHQIHVKLKLAC